MGGGFFRGWPSLKFRHGGAHHVPGGAHQESFVMVNPQIVLDRALAIRECRSFSMVKRMKQCLCNIFVNFDGVWRICLYIYIQRSTSSTFCLSVSLSLCTYVICLSTQARQAKHPKLCKFTAIWLPTLLKRPTSIIFGGWHTRYFVHLCTVAEIVSS